LNCNQDKSKYNSSLPENFKGKSLAAGVPEVLLINIIANPDKKDWRLSLSDM
jgi:hypothetical protein